MKSGVGILLPLLAFFTCAVLPVFAGDAAMDEMVPAPTPPVTPPATTPSTTPVTTPESTPTTPPAATPGDDDNDPGDDDNDGDEGEHPEAEQPMIKVGARGFTLGVPIAAPSGLPLAAVKSVEIIFDLRFRYAAWHNSDQGNALAKQYNDDFLMRSRLGIWMMVNEHVNAMLTFHDWRRFAENKSGGSTVPASVNANFGTEVRQAWIEFVDLFRGAKAKFDLKVGRQVFWTGSGRLISQANWSQTGNLLDGLSSVLAALDGSWNARFFYFRLEREDGSVAGLSQKMRHFFGVHGDLGNKAVNATKGKVKTLQPYIYILRRDEDGAFEPRGYTLITYGVLVGGEASPNFNWEIEGALQGGRLFTSYVQAYMLSFVANWTLNLKNGTYRPVISLLIDWASGDNDSTDKAVHTFNPLLAEGHAYFGEMDVVGRSNVRSAAIRAKLPLPGMDQVNGGQTFQGSVLSVTLSQFWLDNTHDNWYNSQVGLNGIVNSPGGGYSGIFLPARNPHAPHETGAELDLRLTTRLFHAVDASVFFGHFWAESFGDKTGVVPVDRANGDFDFFYMQIELFGGAN